MQYRVDVIISSIDKAVTVLNCFSADEADLSVGEISKATGFSVSNVSRILSTLEVRGVVEKARGYGRYQLGYQTYLWGLLTRRRDNLATLARPVMEQLRDRCGEEVSLYIPVDTHRTCLLRIPSTHAIAMNSPVGGKLPLHAGASGQVLLAYLPPQRRQAVIDSIELIQFSARTIIDPVKLEERLKRIRRQGYAVSREEREAGAYSVVAPVRGEGAKIIASLCVAGPLYRLTPDTLDSYLDAVVTAAGAISKRVGFEGSPGQ